ARSEAKPSEDQKSGPAGSESCEATHRGVTVRARKEKARGVAARAAAPLALSRDAGSRRGAMAEGRGRRRRRSREHASRDAGSEDLRALNLTTQRKRAPARGSAPGTLGELTGAGPPRIQLIAFCGDTCEDRSITDVVEIATLVKDTSRAYW